MSWLARCVELSEVSVFDIAAHHDASKESRAYISRCRVDHHAELPAFMFSC